MWNYFTEQGIEPMKLRRLPWQPVLIGALAFWLITGGTIIRPDNIRWLMGADPAQYLIGWMFFRNGPIFQQPFGANWQFGMELSSSTVTATPSRCWHFHSNW
jgi:hypothetical protein